MQRNSSGRIKPVLVLASTSCYRTTVADELVDEKAELDSTQSRVVAEEKLRSLGATVLCLAGLYGGSRDPVQWLVNGLVKNSRAYINLVHKSDVVKIAEAWVESQLPGERINASDGRHRRWSEMLDCMKSFGVVPSDMQPFVEELENVSSKRVCNSKLVSLLYAGPFHRYPEDGL
ncbi:hypothetical protein EBU99_00480 [bacterium]|nr:hypothetical protein [bacterium]